jgi:hypothetical protein
MDSSESDSGAVERAVSRSNRGMAICTVPQPKAGCCPARSERPSVDPYEWACE